VDQRRFLNPSQPQTLVNATLLCYFEAVFALLDGGYTPFLVIAIGLAAGGFGVANDKKWGYGVAVVASLLNAAIWISLYGTGVLGFPVIISFAFAVVLFVLLVHPMSRDYQRIWFS
jgi:hypothetical protein